MRLFDEHGLLRSASAIALQGFVARVALALLAVAVLGASGQEHVWTRQIAPQIHPNVLPEVFAGIQATVRKVFSSSSWGLIVFAAVLAVWEVSGMVRWIATALLLTLALGVLVRWAPAERRSSRWASVGAAFVVFGWIAQSLIFAWYVRSLGSYKSAVGSLTAVYLFHEVPVRRRDQSEDEEQNVISIIGDVARRARA